MSKQFFRFLRGEINGYYLTRIHDVCNGVSVYIKEFLHDFGKMQFKLEEEITGDETPIDAKDLDGLSIFTGVFPPYVWQDSLLGSLRFTTSKKVEEHEYSERGLFSPSDEAFRFVRTTQEEYDTDINTLAHSEARSSMVEEGRQPIGYFPEGENVINEDGSVDETKLLPAPRPNHADSPYYGDKYLYLAESYPVLAITSRTVLLYVIKAMQWVRYNGVSISSLATFANILCPDFLFIVGIDWDSNFAYGVVTYGIDENYETSDKLMREQVFSLLAGKKMPQLAFNKVAINVTRDAEGRVVSVEVLQ